MTDAARPGSVTAAPPRRNLLSYVADLERGGARPAFLWREGVRTRARTGGETHRGVIACAAALRRAGLREGDPVLIQGPESADWVEALLGTFYAGGVAVPLDAATPGPLRARIAGRVDARLLLAPDDVAAPDGVRRLPFGGWRDAPAGGPRDQAPAAPADVRPDDTAEIIFTSGTTGDPKGVILTHGNMVADFTPLEHGFARYRHVLRRLGRLQVISTLPLSHMFGQAAAIFLPLALGLTVAFVPARPRDVIAAARRHKAWVLFAVPRLLDLLAAEVRRRVAGDHPDEFERRLERRAGRPFWLQALLFPRVRRLFGWRFRVVVSGGAALPEHLQSFWERLGYLVVQGYGLTETAPIVSISNPFERRAGSVGRPLGGQQVRLGPDGEVQVRGPNVTPGYLGEPRARDDWFGTGDVGEIDAAGALRIRGRLKDVIVTPEGENVHPADVEEAFAGLRGVRAVCVIGLPQDGSERVHAVLLLDPGGDAAEAVRLANERLLPKQRVRGHSVWPEPDLPRTATGKVRRASVRDAVSGGAAPGTPARAGAPGGSASAVRDLVAQVAKVPAAELRDATSLVEGLGLASLDLVEIAVAFETEFGTSIPEEILATATIGDLERLVDAGAGRGAAAPPTAAAVEEAAEAPEPDAAVERAPGRLRMPRWARRAPAHAVRRLAEELLFRPFMRVFAIPEVNGLHHLRGAAPPFLFVANHLGYLDTGLFKTMLPRPWRARIAPAMTTRYHRVFYGEAPGGGARYAREWLEIRLLELLFNAWPLPETAGFRKSLAYAGELMDAGFSILIFPEGRHVPEGTRAPFRAGIGIFARELRAPIVPAWVEGTSRVLPDDGTILPRRGKTRLTLGAPFTIAPGTPPAAATARVEEAVRALAPR